jgi:hypothetical protein
MEENLAGQMRVAPIKGIESRFENVTIQYARDAF